MIVSQFVPAVFLKATGKQPTFITGSAKWLKIVALANLYIDQWQNEVGVDWYSYYTPNYPIGPVTNTDTYAIPSAVRKLTDSLEDPITITYLDGITTVNYQLVPIDELQNYSTGYYAAKYGDKIKFNHVFTTADPQFGGPITIGAYTFAPYVQLDSDIIPVDIPNWLVFAVAAEYIRTDVTRQQQYTNIVQEANQLMEQMKLQNEAQVTQVQTPWNPTPFTTLYGSDGFVQP